MELENSHYIDVLIKVKLDDNKDDDGDDDGDEDDDDDDDDDDDCEHSWNLNFNKRCFCVMLDWKTLKKHDNILLFVF